MKEDFEVQTTFNDMNVNEEVEGGDSNVQDTEDTTE